MNNIADILINSSKSFPDKVALQKLSDDGSLSKLTYRQLAYKSQILAQKLIELGAAKNMPVALLDKNRPEWPVSYFAIHLTGATFIPIDAKLKALEIKSILQRSGTKILLTTENKLKYLSESLETLADIKTLCVDDILSEIGDSPSDANLEIYSPCNMADISTISFTSGTTGNAKGVMLTHENVISNVTACTKMLECTTRDMFLSLLPLNHMFEQTVGFLLPVHVGASITYLDSLNPKSITRAFNDAGVTLCTIVPAIARLLYKSAVIKIEKLPSWRRKLFWFLNNAASFCEVRRVHLGKFVFSGARKKLGKNLRFFVSGGAALDDEVARFFTGLGIPILQGYGLSETSPVISSNTPKHHRIGSVGKCVKGVEAKIVPMVNTENGTGEIAVRGSNIMAGYFEDHETTEETIKGGWLHTGDIGRIDKKGFIYITGRLKNVIIDSNGKNVFPEEIEAEISKSPLIKEVCVIGLTSTDKNQKIEQIVALVVPNEENITEEDPATINEILRKEVKTICLNLADYKRPKLFGVWPGEFPQSTTLKILKRKVSEQLDTESLMNL